MLTITIHNDGTGDQETGNYDYTVKINGFVLDRGRLEGHKRADGWKELLQMLIEKAKEDF